MGVVCCKKNFVSFKNETIQIDNEKIDNTQTIINNDNIKMQQISLGHKSTNGKKHSSKKITPQISINRGATVDNYKDTIISNKLKIKNIPLEKKRKSFAISMDNQFKNKFLYQKKFSKILNPNILQPTNLSHKKLYQVPPNQSNKNLRIFEENEYSNLNNILENKLKDNKEKDNKDKENISTRKSTLVDSIVIKSTSIKSLKKHPPIKEINKELTEKQREMLINVLTYNELIDSDMSESFINMILNTISYKRIKDGVVFFEQNQNQDIFYIIEKGKLEYGIDNQIFELSKLNGIGTQALLKYKTNTCYIKSIGRTYLFVLPLEKYRKMVGEIERKRNEEKFAYLKKHFLFSDIDDNKLMNLCSLSNKVKIHENKVLLEEDSLSDKVYYIISGCIKVVKNNIIIKKITDGNIFGEIGLFNQIESLYKYIAEPKTSLIQIAYEDIFSCLGDKCVQYIVQQLYINAVKNDEFLSHISNDKIIERCFPLFQLKFYYNDTILMKNQKKLILPISGTVIKNKLLAKDISNIPEKISMISNKNILNNGLFHTDSVTIDVDIMYNLIGDETIVFECDWESLLPKLIKNDIFKTYKINPLDLIISLRKFSVFKYLSEFKMFQIINSIKEKKCRPGQIILKDGPKSNNFFYIYNGEIKININGVDLKTLIKGKSFGDISSQIVNFSQIADFISSTNSILFVIDKDTYNDIVNKSDFFLNLRKMINLNDVNITLENLYYITDLGSGSYGQVYLVHNKKKLFALKTAELYKISVNKENANSYLNEKTIMQQVLHPFIVHLNNTFKTRDYIFFIMEYVNGINMRKYLEMKDKEKLRNLEEVKFFGGILFSVLHYLAQRKIIHRDIKPDNLMMNSNGYLKLIDFGVAKYLMKDYTNTVTGTPHYMSPEVILGKPYSFEIDYWSTGVVLYEIFYGRVPFGGLCNNINDIYKEIIESNLHLPSDPKNENFNNLINLLLNKNPSVRISKFTNVKNHNFFKNFDFDELLNFSFEAPFKPINPIVGNNENELLKNDNVPLLNYMRNHIYQSASDIDENFLKKSIVDDLLSSF